MMFFLWFQIQNTCVTINNIHLKAHHSPCGKTCVRCCRSCLPVGRPSGSRVFNYGRHGRIWTCLFHLWGAETGASFYGWKVRKVVGLLKHYFYTVWLFRVSVIYQKHFGKHAMKVYRWCMMYDGFLPAWNPAVFLRNDAYYDLWHIQMTYWNVFESGMDDAAFFPATRALNPLQVADIGMPIDHVLFCSKEYHYHYHLIVNSTIVTSNISYTYSTCFCKYLVEYSVFLSWIVIWLYHAVFEYVCAKKNRAKQPTKDLSIDISPPGVRCFSPAARRP